MSPAEASASRRSSLKNYAHLALITLLAFVVMGYHPGLEDDAFYLAAVKRDLNPALFPHDASFFRLQFQATIFDKLIALSIRVTHLPVAWAEFGWQLAAIFALLWGCRRIARRCFSDPAAQWAAVCLVAALLTLPVSGTGINLADQYLHPRTLATGAILAAVVEVMDRRFWRAGILLAAAFSVHAIMAGFGISLCAFLWWARHTSSRRAPIESSALLLFAWPLSWMFEPASDAWREAASTRSFYFLTRWEWYEWLGIFAPILLLVFFRWLLARHAGGTAALPELPILVSGVIYYGVFQTVAGLAIMLPPSLERLRPFEPMRYLHLVYLFFFLFAGGLLGRYVLRRHIYRWLLLFLPLSGGMYYAQQQMLPATAHLELPGAASQNAWLQAFSWIRQNTPVDSLFALDPHYVELTGEDYHGFRALAERSVLADYVKDGGMAARVPRLAPRWLREVKAQTGWKTFQTSDFERLEQQFGVKWVVLSRDDAVVTNGLVGSALTSIEERQPHGFTCPYQNRQVLVCRLY
ncbi:MAG TPA: DUF6798 domain-containing protein [Verrucomicrobiae bacterium]|nr:DUF6798 domain-containing protein [Verrucomicrobiae bacterium]